MVATDKPHADTLPAQELLVPWDEIRALHVRGMTLRAIADKYGLSYGALRSRSSRENWTHSVKIASAHVAHVATEDLMASAKLWIGKIDTVVHAAVNNITARGLDKLTLRDLTIALDCAEKANRMARLNYGLDADGSANPRVQVNVAIAGSAVQTSAHDILDIDSLRAVTHVAPVAPVA